MGLKKLAIILDQPVNYAGQMISGRLEVQIDEPMLIRAICLNYSGVGSVLWTETTAQHNRNFTGTYSNSEDYLRIEQLVFGNNVEDYKLPEGEHVFIFSCQLPMNLPSVFEGEDGHVRYFVKAAVIRHGKFNHETTVPFRVMSAGDLNDDPLAAVPVEEHISKAFWGYPEQFFMSVAIPVRGFVPGQVIPLKVSYNSELGNYINTIRVTLDQNVTYHATNNSRTAEMCISKNDFPVRSGQSCGGMILDFKLPDVQPSYLKFCKIIDLDYQLTVKAKVKPWYLKNVKICTEIIVGNIPLTTCPRQIPDDQLLREPVDQENRSYIQAPDCRPPDYGVVLPSGIMHGAPAPPSYEETMELEKSGKGFPEEDPDHGGGGRNNKC